MSASTAAHAEVPPDDGSPSRLSASSCDRPYVGPDRRHRPAIADTRPFVARVLTSAVAAVAVWVVVLCSRQIQRPESVGTMISLAHSLAGGLLLTSAGLCYAAWRITGLARLGWGATALMLAGFATPVMGILARAVGPESASHGSAALARSAIAAGVIALAAVGLTSPAVNARLQPMRLVIPCIAVCLVAASLPLRRGAISAVPPALATVTTTVHLTVSVLWLVLAAGFARVASQHRSGGAALLSVVTALMGIDGVVRSLELIEFRPRTVTTAAVELFAAVVIAGLSATGLWRLHRGSGDRLLAMTGELRGTRRSLAELEREQARRLHDARNAIFAVAGATEILASPTRPDSLDTQHLRHLVTAELDRLGRLLDPNFRSTIRDYSPADVIEPLVLAHRLGGSTITADLSDHRVHGRPEVLGNAVANLLTNARVHAPDAQVWVTAEPEDDVLRVTVADDGPGIPPDERPGVVLPGIRGSRADSTEAPGSGLGLASATQAMSEVRGTLRLDDREGGGTMVTLTIPLDERSTDEVEDRTAGSAQAGRRNGADR